MSHPSVLLTCGFPRRGIIATVELFTAEAPTMCQAIRERLPIEADSYHTKWNGAELFVILPPFVGLPAENPSRNVQVGDVVVFQFDATYRGAPVQARRGGLGDYSELGFFYGQFVRSYGPAGPVLGTRIGRIVQGIETLADAARDMRRTGFEAMTLTALS